MKRITIIITFVLLLLFVIFTTQAVLYTPTSFLGENETFNLTLPADTNVSRYIDIPMAGYVQNVTLTIEGVEI